MNVIHTSRSVLFIFCFFSSCFGMKKVDFSCVERYKIKGDYYSISSNPNLQSDLVLFVSENKLSIWSRSKTAFIKHYKISSDLCNVTWSPDGRRLAGTCRCKVINKSSWSDYEVTGIALFPDLHDALDKLSIIKNQSSSRHSRLYGMKWSNDGKYIVTFCKGGLGLLWSIKGRKVVKKLSLATSTVRSLSWLPQERFVFSTGHFETGLYSIKTDKLQTSRLQTEEVSHVWSVSCSQCGRYIAYYYPGWMKYASRLYVWDRIKEKMITIKNQTMQKKYLHVEKISWHPNGDLIAFFYEKSNQIYIWSLTQRKQVKVLVVNGKGRIEIADLSWTPDGDLLSYSSDNILRLWSDQLGSKQSSDTNDSSFGESEDDDNSDDTCSNHSSLDCDDSSESLSEIVIDDKSCNESQASTMCSLI